MSKPTNKTYTLKLMTDMYEIPEDRFDDFIIQLKKWHKETRSIKDLLETLGKTMGMELPEEYGILKWLDDGIEEGHTKVNILARPLNSPRKKKS